MNASFEKKIAAFRALKAEANRAQDQASSMASFVLSILATLTGQFRGLYDDSGPSPTEGALWRMLWSMGVELPPAEFLGSATVFCCEFIYSVVAFGAGLAAILGLVALSKPLLLTKTLLLDGGICFVLFVAVRSAIAVFSARSSKAKLGLATWAEFEVFDEPLGPTLSEIVAAREETSKARAAK
jgi:hypothetical protein